MAHYTDALTQLGSATTLPQYPDEAVLERVPNPQPGQSYAVRFTQPEFTSLCPLTGQPDFAHLVIDYLPGRWLIESKSLKLYLWRFREMGVFNEPLVATIADDLFGQIAPEWIEVEGHFHSRGGIAIHVKARREATDNEDIPF